MKNDEIDSDIGEAEQLDRKNKHTQHISFMRDLYGESEAFVAELRNELENYVRPYCMPFESKGCGRRWPYNFRDGTGRVEYSVDIAYRPDVEVAIRSLDIIEILLFRNDELNPGWSFLAVFKLGGLYESMDDPELKLRIDQLLQAYFQPPPSSIPEATIDGKPFVPNKLQGEILKALDGKAMKKDKLAEAVAGGDGSRLYKPGGIKDLRSTEPELVKHETGLGYFRPDSPPKPL